MMSTLSQTELLDYIKTAIEIETDLATQEQIINDYKSYSESKKPQLVTLPLPTAPINDYRGPTGNGSLVGGILLTGASCFLPAFLGYGLGYSGFGTVFLLLGIGGLIWSLSISAQERDQYTSYQQNYSASYATYQRQLADVQSRNKKSSDDYHKNIGPWTESTKEMNSTLLTALTETQSLLTRFYGNDVIYPKYRTLPALTSIYEYFVTGRCTELTGPHGAYNLYEDELRKDTVISQLNTVIENLEQIKQNQYMLYQQVKAIQENTNSIASELRQIKGYTVQIAQLTALNAYYAALNERNTRITMYYHL